MQCDGEVRMSWAAILAVCNGNFDSGGEGENKGREGSATVKAVVLSAAKDDKWDLHNPGAGSDPPTTKRSRCHAALLVPIQIDLVGARHHDASHSYLTTYPRRAALSRMRLSRVTTVTCPRGRPRTSRLARCTAPSVRTGSTGNGRPARYSTSSVSGIEAHRSCKVWSARTMICSASLVIRPVARARTRARKHSANVRAEVTHRASGARIASTPASSSSSAESSALDSI